jgi:hypothetical protein
MIIYRFRVSSDSSNGSFRVTLDDHAQEGFRNYATEEELRNDLKAAVPRTVDKGLDNIFADVAKNGYTYFQAELPKEWATHFGLK